jgi:hypothetical protein
LSIFTLHSSVVEDYRDFVRSFFTVADDRAREFIEHELVAQARLWPEALLQVSPSYKMQRKLSECPGFVGCHPPGVESPGRVTVQPGAADEAVEFLKRRFHVGQVGWQKGLGLTVEILPRRKGVSRAVIRRRLAPVEQFQFSFDKRPPLEACFEQPGTLTLCEGQS